MAYTFTSRISGSSTLWDFRVNQTYQLTLNESNAFHASVLNLLKDSTHGSFYKDYLEELALIEMSIGVRPALAKFVETFKETLGFDSIPDPEIPVEIDPNT